VGLAIDAAGDGSGATGDPEDVGDGLGNGVAELLGEGLGDGAASVTVAVHDRHCPLNRPAALDALAVADSKQLVPAGSALN
jgi:hypothetical protein